MGMNWDLVGGNQSTDNLFGPGLWGEQALEDDAMLNPESDLFGGFQSKSRVDSRVLPEQGLTTFARTAREDRAERAAMKEYQNNAQWIQQKGLENTYNDMLAEENQEAFPGSMATATEGLFDWLQSGNFATAGFFDEFIDSYNRTGGNVARSAGAAFVRAADEFADAFTPDWVYESDNVKKMVYGDLLHKHAGMEDTSDKMPWSSGAAVLGLAMDIFFDPLTYTGYGLGKSIKLLRGLEPVKATEKMISHSAMGREFRQRIMPMSLLRGIESGENIDALVKGLNDPRLRREGVPEVTEKDIREGGAAFIASLGRRSQTIEMETQQLRNELWSLFGEMNEKELRVAGAYMLDQPEYGKKIVEKMTMAPEDKERLLRGVERFRDYLHEFFEKDVEAGILSPSQLRGSYAPGIPSVTERSQALFESMVRYRFGDDAVAQYLEEIEPAFRTKSGMGGSVFYQKGKKYPLVGDRTLDMVDTEQNISLMGVRRGLESIRKRNTVQFVDGILSDHRIAMPLEEKMVEDIHDPMHKLLKDHGMKIWENKGVVREGESAFFALPEAMVDHLDHANKVFSDPNEMGNFWRLFKEVQGTWKAYALMSPGYHMRNMYSNIFLNMLGGVYNPKKYHESMILQVEDTAYLPRPVRSIVEASMGGRKTLDDVFFVNKKGDRVSARQLKEAGQMEGVDAGGMLGSDLVDSIERQMLDEHSRAVKGQDGLQIGDMEDEWGSALERQERLAETLRHASPNIKQEDALALSATLDVVASRWAVNRGLTPQDFYDKHLTGIYPGLPEGLDIDNPTRNMLFELLENADFYSRLQQHITGEGGLFEQLRLNGGFAGYKNAADRETIPVKVLESAIKKGVKEGKFTEDEVVFTGIMDFITEVGERDQRINREYIDAWLDKPHNYMQGGIEVEVLNAKGTPEELSYLFNSNDLRKAFDVKQGEYSIIGDARYGEYDQVSEADKIMTQREPNKARKSAVVRRADSKGKFGYGANRESLREYDWAQSMDPPEGFEYAIEDWHAADRLAETLGIRSEDALPLEISNRLKDNVRVVESNGDFIVFAKDRSSLEELLSPHEAFPITTHGEEMSQLLPGGENYNEWFIRWNPGRKDRTGPNSTVEWNKDNTVSDAHLSNMRENRNNLIAHVRTKDYIDENGDKVLLVLEMQSDWARTFAELKRLEPEVLSEITRLRQTTDNAHLWEFKNQQVGIMDMVAKNLNAHTKRGIYRDASGNPLKANSLPEDNDLFVKVTEGSDDEGFITYFEIKDPTDKRWHKTADKEGIERSIAGRRETSRELNNDLGRAEQWGSQADRNRAESAWEADQIALDRLNKRIALLAEDTVQNRNPFITQDRWVDVATRKMTRMAMNEGYDRIAWVSDPKQLAAVEGWLSQHGGYTSAMVEGMAERMSSKTYARIGKTLQQMSTKMGWKANVEDTVLNVSRGDSGELSIKEINKVLETKADDLIAREEVLEIERTGIDPTAEAIRSSDLADPAEVHFLRREKLREKRGYKDEFTEADSKEVYNAIAKAMEKEHGRPFDHIGDGDIHGLDPSLTVRDSHGLVNRKLFLEALPKDLRNQVEKSLDYIQGPNPWDVEAIPNNFASISLRPARESGAPFWLFQRRPVTKPRNATSAQSRKAKKDSVRGVTTFAEEILADGTNNPGSIQAAIYAGERADTTTFIHEIGHVIRRFMIDEGDEAALNKWVFGEKKLKELKKKLGPDETVEWGVPEEEKFAIAFEEFVRKGIPPHGVSKFMEGPFSRLKETMNELYADLKKNKHKFSDETEEIMRRVVGRSGEPYPEKMLGPKAVIKSVEEGVPEPLRHKARRWAKGPSFKAGKIIGKWGKEGDAKRSLTEWNQTIGRAFENNARWAHFIQKWQEGASFEQAGKSVKRFLFDYQELTPWEQDYAKTVIPFYTWMRKNIPLQIEMLIERPEFYAKIPKIMGEIEAMSASLAEDNGNIPKPDWFDEVNAVRLPWDNKGQPTYLMQDLPFQDLNRLNYKDLLSSMTPALKVWAALSMDKGYDFFLESPIERFAGEPATVDLFGTTMEMPINKKLLYAAKTVAPPVGKLWRMGEKASKGQLEDQLLREIFGLSVTSVDVDAVMRSERYKKARVSSKLRQIVRKRAEAFGWEEALKESGSRLFD